MSPVLMRDVKSVQGTSTSPLLSLETMTTVKLLPSFLRKKDWSPMPSNFASQLKATQLEMIFVFSGSPAAGAGNAASMDAFILETFWCGRESCTTNQPVKTTASKATTAARAKCDLVMNELLCKELVMGYGNDKVLYNHVLNIKSTNLQIPSF